MTTGQNVFPRVPVEQGQFVDVKCLSAADVDSVKLQVDGWAKSINSEDEDKDLDAVEMGQLAIRRWMEAREKLRAAGSLSDFRNKVLNNPNAEVTVVLVARAPWLENNPVAAVCHFRRTWSRNITVGFLASAPGLPVAAVGVGLLLQVAVIARSFKAPMIWGETTPTSARLYERIFGLKGVKDLVRLDKAEYRKFIPLMQAKQKNSNAGL